MHELFSYQSDIAFFLSVFISEYRKVTFISCYRFSPFTDKYYKINISSMFYHKDVKSWHSQLPCLMFT